MFEVTEAALISAVDTITGILDQGDPESTTPAQIIIWTGAMPDRLADPVTVGNDILATVDLANPAFGPAIEVTGNAVEAILAQTDTTTGVQTGDATFFRAYDHDGNAVMQGDVGPDGDPDAALTINQVSILAGADVDIVRFVIGVPIV
jgi:hypothetical protein